MENVVSKVFDSPLSLDQMCAALSARVGGVAWTLRESQPEGRNVKGLTSEGVKIRIVKERPAVRHAVEVYFPLSEEAEPLLSHADKRAFMKRLDGHVLAALGATNLQDDQG